MIDWSRVSELKEEVGEEGFAEVIQMFFEEVEEVLDVLDPKDTAGLASHLHFLKGSALNIGLNEVNRLCQNAEANLRGGINQLIETEAIRSAFEISKAEFSSRVLTAVDPRA